MKELAESVKTSSEPATMPGTDSGRTTERNVWTKLQPMVRAASSSRWSIRVMTPRIDSVMNGSSTCTMPMTMAGSVCMIAKLRPARPRSRRMSGMRPLRPSSTIHPKVRTTTDVISGRMTSTISHSLSRGPTRAMM